MVMTEPIQYPYSLKFSLATIILMILLMLLLFNNVVTANTTAIWIVFVICVIIFFALLVLLTVKRLVPALKGDTALALDDEGISDYIRNVSINWKDIKEITLIRGRTASIMQIDLKWESDYGSQIAIPLRWIKGKDDEIYETVLACFHDSSSSFDSNLSED
jgi:hypothetical protein